MVTPLNERVAHGASEMDWRYPDWAALADPESLDMETVDKDLVAQLRHEYPFDAFAGMDPEDVSMGFCVVAGESFDELTDLWVAEIRKRRDKAVSV